MDGHGQQPRRHTGQGPSGPTLLTISGAITLSFLGVLDATIDQMMGKHGIQFDKAYALDAAALARMPAVTIKLKRAAIFELPEAR